MKEFSEQSELQACLITSCCLHWDGLFLNGLMEVQACFPSECQVQIVTTVSGLRKTSEKEWAIGECKEYEKHLKEFQYHFQNAKPQTLLKIQNVLGNFF